METRTSNVDVILSLPWGNLRHLPVNFLSLKDSRRSGLIQINLADIGFIHFALHVDFADVAMVMIRVAWEPRTRMELTASPTLTSRESTSPSIGLTIVELCKSLPHFQGLPGLSTCARPWRSPRANGQVALRADCYSGPTDSSSRSPRTRLLDITRLEHLLGAFHAELEIGHVRTSRRLCWLQGGGCGSRRLAQPDSWLGRRARWLRVAPCRVRRDVALLTCSIVHIQLLHNAAGFGLHLDFRERLNLPVATTTRARSPRSSRELGRINFMIGRGRHRRHNLSNQDQCCDGAEDEPARRFWRFSIPIPLPYWT